MITPDAVRDALALIRPYVYKTPLIYADSLSRMLGGEVYLKCENLQRTGSFKVRGAFNKMLKMAHGGGIKASGSATVIAASMGNHAQGVSYAASRLGIRSNIVMPEGASIVKEEAVRAYGGEVMLYGKSLIEAINYAMSMKDHVFIHPYNDADIISGQGTIALEVLDELDNIDLIIVPVGGGGLIAGISLAVKSVSPKTKVVGVQTESATSAFSSFRQKALVEESQTAPTIADGIAVGRVGEIPFEIIKNHVDDIALVKEGSVAKAILLFLERKKLVTEGAGAVSLSYCLENPDAVKGRRIVLIISGGNIDFTLMDRIIHKGLLESGRIGMFSVTLQDVPGSLHAVTGIIASQRGNILNVVHQRFGSRIPVGMTEVQFMVEVKGTAHLEEIVSAVKSQGIEARII